MSLLALFLLPACDRDDPTTTGPEPEDTGREVPPVELEEVLWLRDEVQAPGSVTFTEVHYHPVDEGEWLELHNPMALDMDLSGWRLDGGVSFAFAEGTVIPAGGYLVVAADPALLEVPAQGPYTGSLANDGERVELRSTSDRLIDIVQYLDDTPWPVHPDGSGLTLAKLAPTLASDHAENWTFSDRVGGTPGEANGVDPFAPPLRVVLVDEDAEWLYDASGAYPGEDWAEPDHDDSAWAADQAPFFAGGSDEPVTATARATADNYFAMYLGHADGSELRLVGEDSDGSWTTVQEIDLEAGPLDHLYVAAWELTGDSTSPQMVIAEVDLPEGAFGTDASGFEWTLGPVGDNPGGLPSSPPPDEADLVELVTDASWDVPAVEAARGSSPWGSSVGGWFTDAAGFIWADTFSSDSVTNQDDTYVLFRSIDPLLGAQGNEDLGDVPTTVTFRTHFDFQGDPAGASLTLDCELDDGAVIYLNGVEVLRENMPDGPVDASTLASAVVDDAALFADVPADTLVEGDNVLAVELHQAEDPDEDLLFACLLRAEIEAASSAPTLVFSEVPAAGGGWVELTNLGTATLDLDGVVVRSTAGDEVALDAGSLGSAELLDLEVELAAEAGDRLILATENAVLDVVRLEEWPRARDEDGHWRVPVEETPGEVNQVELIDAIVLNEVQYHRGSEEWIELFNRSDDAVDVSGWQLTDAVVFELPEDTVLGAGEFLVITSDPPGMAMAHPDVDVFGPFTGGLGNGGDRILLLDALGNPADEVHYFDGGRWPAAADGGGSSLELRDPWADNAVAEAWAASDEGARAEWINVQFQGVAESSVVGPDGVWEELVVGLLDSGEVLIDDLSVVQDPDSDPVELLQNGSFEDAAHWRLLGNHGDSKIVPDPEDAGNSVLRLVATGGAGHMHNHAETTLVQPVAAREVEVSFRARWVSGSNQLHSRLYFNRLPRTTLVDRPVMSGTPGAENSTRVTNLGPTLSALRQDVAVPSPDEPVVISVSAQDPDGIASLVLWSSVDGGALEQATMAEQDGVWSATVEGQSAGSLVHFFVEAEDELGAVAMAPAAGADARALYKVDDGNATTNGRHVLRILMTPEDSDQLHDELELMSEGRIGATVVYDEAEVFHDVGVRLKGSQRGRPEAARIGYGIRFHDEQPFRGSHTSVLIDRSEGVGYGQREMLINLMMTRSGSVSGEHNDVIQLLGPVSTYDGSAELQLDRFSNLVLDAQFPAGSDGTRFEYELIYYPTTTSDGTAEGFKRPQPDSVVGTYITDLGEDPEDYRWLFLIKNNAAEDRYDEILDLCWAFSQSGDDFLDAAEDVIDVEQWLRAHAFATLSGATDQYGGAGSQHNAQFWVRPEDGRVLYFPHDLDFFSSSQMPVIGNGDLSRLLEDPENLRSYHGHLNDIIEVSYNSAYLQPWCDQLSELLPGQDFDAHCAFVDDRADWVLYGSSDGVHTVFPAEDFEITTNDGDDFEVSGDEVALEGQAWVDVRAIALDGQALELTWLDSTTWEVTVPLSEGENVLTLEALDLRGESVGSDTVVVTRN
ncbi:MAG: hypothetical protein GY913_29660 [Proteobacteria bacterium]|nr:hypothetical protein [Pseudomonadota bacterium]MCP4921083.1 hypothetical protein [Pseudomonadota bacterium]